MASTKKGFSLGWMKSPIDAKPSDFSDDTLNMIADIIAANPAWFYNWNTTTPDFIYQILQQNGIDYTPCVWNSSFRLSDSLSQNPNPKFILGFNEPDLAGQGNMTTTQVIDAWGKLASQAPKSSILVGPAISDGNWTYLKTVYDGIRSSGYRMDAFGYHCYRTDMNAFGFSNSPNSIPNMADNYGVPGVISECGYSKWNITWPYWDTSMKDFAVPESVKFWQNCENSKDVLRYCAFFSVGGYSRDSTEFAWLSRVGSLYTELFKQYAAI